VNFVAGVKTDSDTRNLTTNGALCVHQPLEQKGTSNARLSKLNAWQARAGPSALRY
jgi:hypothetical protein